MAFSIWAPLFLMALSVLAMRGRHLRRVAARWLPLWRAPSRGAKSVRLPWPDVHNRYTLAQMAADLKHLCARALRWVSHGVRRRGGLGFVCGGSRTMGHAWAVHAVGSNGLSPSDVCPGMAMRAMYDLSAKHGIRWHEGRVPNRIRCVRADSTWWLCQKGVLPICARQGVKEAGARLGGAGFTPGPCSGLSI